MQSRLIRLIGMIFSNGAMFAVSEKFENAPKRSSNSYSRCVASAHKFTRQLAHTVTLLKDVMTRI